MRRCGEPTCNAEDSRRALSHSLSCANSDSSLIFFFFNDTATTEIYTLSLHDALPISRMICVPNVCCVQPTSRKSRRSSTDRKSTRLNSSHLVISYAVFCLKKKNNSRRLRTRRPTLGSTLPVDCVRFECTAWI